MGLPYAKHKARSWAPSGGGQGVHAVLLSLRATSTTQELNWGVYKTAFKVPSSIYTNMTFLEFCSNRPGQEASEHGANSLRRTPQQSPQRHFYSVTQEAAWAKADKACDGE